VAVLLDKKLLLFDKGFLITFGQLYFKQASATGSKYLTQLHYAHSHVMNRGPKGYLLLVLKTDMPVDQEGYYNCLSRTKTDVPFSLPAYLFTLALKRLKLPTGISKYTDLSFHYTDG
jgi:hypothetical protein